MSEKDHTEKILEDFNDVFADIFNTLVFKEKYLREDKLYPGPTESIYKAATNGTAEQRRDILKHYLGNDFQILSVGIENQASHDKYMPIRIMGYDYATYREMINNKKKLCPVITIVLNFTNKQWRKPKSIHGLLSLPKELRNWVSDYRIKVFDIAYLSDAVIESFTSDFRLIARFFKHKRLKRPPEDFFQSEDTITHVEAFFELLSVFTKDSRYTELLDVAKDIISDKGGRNKLCYIYDTIEQRGIEKGKQLGIEQGKRLGIEQGKKLGIDKGKLLMLKELVADGTLTLLAAANRLSITVPQLEEQFLTLAVENSN